jgi:C4-dicarboxylate-specific signal transduction histidine kinase
MNKHQVRLRLELTDDLPPALGDKVLLQRVILNLILNGIDAMNTVEDRSRDLIIRTQSSEEGW